MLTYAASVEALPLYRRVCRELRLRDRRVNAPSCSVAHSARTRAPYATALLPLPHTLLNAVVQRCCCAHAATSVCGLKLLVYAALRYQCMRPSATSVCGLTLASSCCADTARMRAPYGVTDFTTSVRSTAEVLLQREGEGLEELLVYAALKLASTACDLKLLAHRGGAAAA
jgi:hypothetical protein